MVLADPDLDALSELGVVHVQPLRKTSHVRRKGKLMHRRRNSARHRIATLLGAPAEGPLTIPVEADEAAALDERCGITTPGEHAH
jgi:hypothetical protein